MHRGTYALGLLACGLVAGAGWRVARHGDVGGTVRAERASPAAGAIAPVMSEAPHTDAVIDFYRERVDRDPEGAADRATLAGLYLQRSRETGDFEDFRRAEELARRSIAIRGKRNAKAYRVLAASLLAQHRFADALAVAEELVASWPAEAAHRALLAEIQLEIGDYDAARATMGSLGPARDQLSVAPRLARWAEITGNTAEERRILYAARDRAARTDLPREQKAWFHLRVGEHELRHGRLAEAEQAFRAGLAVEPNDFRLYGALARLEARRHRWKEAIAYGDLAGAAADIATLETLGDAYAALGDDAKAELYYREVEAAAAETPEPFNRPWTRFRLDHDRRVPETLEILEQEIRVRRDVYGYDQLAWAYYRAGRFAAARAAMQQALRMGTRDAALFFHAALIERALGSDDAARRHLETALAINPRFHPTQPDRARALLDSLRAGS